MTNITISFRTTLLVCLTGSVLLLNGCGGRTQHASPSDKSVAVQNTEKTDVQKETERLAQCQKELTALEGLSPEKYKSYRQKLDQLMNGAAQYAGLRTQVNSETRSTVDALYRYKVSRLCADITQATLIGLADRGELLK